MKNYYEILGVKMEDSQIKIKKAYFTLVRKYPPDHFPDEFMEIREAYETLSNEETRKEYDDVIVLSPAARAVFEYSRNAFAEGDYETAISGLEEVAERAPESSLIRSLLGQAYRENGNSVKAIRVFEKLTSEYPDNAAFMGHLGEAYLDRGWHKRARATFEKATHLDEDNISFWLGWSETCKIAKDYETQREVLERAASIATEKDWDSIVLYMNIVQNDVFRRDVEGAKVHLDQLTDLALVREDIRQSVGWSLSELADILLNAGWLNLARVTVDHVIQLLPEEEDLPELKKKLDFFVDKEDVVDNFLRDADIHQDIKDLVAIEIIPGYTDNENIPAELISLMLESYVVDDIKPYLPSIHRLKEHYPQLYDTKKGFFEALKSPSKRRKILKKVEREYKRHKYMFDIFDDDWDDDFIGPQQPYVRDQPKVGRNDPCPCGSGKKFKKCCGK